MALVIAAVLQIAAALTYYVGLIALARLFVVTVFAAHVATTWGCRRSHRLKRLIRGAPRPLIVNGAVSHRALEEEGLTYDDLLAGLRKVGEPGPGRIRLATLEETGQISVAVGH